MRIDGLKFKCWVQCWWSHFSTVRCWWSGCFDVLCQLLFHEATKSKLMHLTTHFTPYALINNLSLYTMNLYEQKSLKWYTTVLLKAGKSLWKQYNRSEIYRISVSIHSEAGNIESNNDYELQSIELDSPRTAFSWCIYRFFFQLGIGVCAKKRTCEVVYSKKTT